MWEKIESTHARIYTVYGIQRHVRKQRSIPRMDDGTEDVRNLNSTARGEGKNLNVLRRWRVNMQYSLVGARFSVLSTLPLGLAYPPIPLVPPTPILHQGKRKIKAIPLCPLCQVTPWILSFYAVQYCHIKYCMVLHNNRVNFLRHIV